MLLGRILGANGSSGPTPGINTLLLNHFDGTDGATSFSDAIPGITWSFTGSNAELDTARSKFGVSSVYFSAASTTRLNGETFISPHSGDWTIEGFVNISSGDFFRLGALDTGGAEIVIIDIAVGSDTVRMYAQDNVASPIFDNTVGVTVNVDTWYHFALCRNSGTSYEGFFNGNRLFSESTSTDTDAFVKGTMLTSSITSGPQWCDEFRIRKAVQYSGATYSVPSSAFVAD